MATDYPFTKAVYIPKLEDEILTSSITGTLDSIELFGIDDLHVWFVSPLSGPDETTLNGIVSAHVAGYVDTSDDFLRLNVGPEEIGQNPTMDAGLLVLRGTNPDGIIKYNETLGTWECGVVGNMNRIASVTDLPLIEILLVVDDATTPSAQDTAKKALIESFDYTVVMIEATDTMANFDTAVATASAVYISEEITSNQLNIRLRDACIGIVNDEDALADEFGFSTVFALYSDDEIDITDNTHYITEVFSTGLLTITTSPQPLHTLAGTIAPGVQTLAEQPVSANRTLVILDPGADITITAGSDTAAGRRVYLPWGGGAFDINTLTDDGKTLMRRAIEWATALGCPQSRSSVSEMTDVTTVADVAGSLGGTFFNIDAIGTAYYVWYDVDNLSTDPAPAGRTGIEVDISANDPDDAVASATWTAMNAVGDFGVQRDVPPGNILNITNNIKGAVPDATDGSAATGFTITTVKQGSPTDNAIPRFDGFNGKLQNSPHTISDGGILKLGGNLDVNSFEIINAGTGRIKIRTTGANNDIELNSADDIQLVAAASGEIELTGNQIRFDGPLVSFPVGSNNDLSLTPDGTGNLVLDGIKWPQADGTAGQILETDGIGQLSFVTPSGGGGGTANDAVQGRRTTALTITTAFQDVTFEATDVETDAAVIEHNNTNTDNFDIKVTGTYEISYDIDVEVPVANGDTWLITGKVRKSDADALLGSQANNTVWKDSSVSGDIPMHLSNSFIANLTAGDFITLQIDGNDQSGSGGAPATRAGGVTLKVIRLK